MSIEKYSTEVQAGERFEFGKNWSDFLSEISEDKVVAAVASLKEMLGVDSLAGKSFLDAGSGSGLYSLAAIRLGASVHSFDFDPYSVECTRQLKSLMCGECEHWIIESGSLLDMGYMETLGTFDVVYSWGVLHHTGDMATGFANIARRVVAGGKLFVAIYNDQGWVSGYWDWIKRRYNRNRFLRPFLIGLHIPYLYAARWLIRRLTGRPTVERGMSIWYDMLDWLGGYPFEVAKPEVVFKFFNERGFSLSAITTCGGRMGCNEFVFSRGYN